MVTVGTEGFEPSRRSPPGSEPGLSYHFQHVPIIGGAGSCLRIPRETDFHFTCALPPAYPPLLVQKTGFEPVRKITTLPGGFLRRLRLPVPPLPRRYRRHGVLQTGSHHTGLYDMFQPVSAMYRAAP